MQEAINIHNIGLLGGEIRLRPFPEVLKEVQEHITKHYASTLKDDPDESRELIKSYIQKYLEANRIGVADTEPGELCELIYGEMTGFSFLTKYLYRDDVEEININQWKDVKITYSNGDILPSKEHFNSPQHAIDVIRRMLHKSGMIFDSAQTTLMSRILGQVPYNKRIVTLEQGCREFDLTVTDEDGNVLNNVVHLVTRFSDDPKQNITLVKLLETTLTINPDCVAVAEMKGAESMRAINAANTGHAVITTIHANSCADTYYRMVTLCKQSYSMDDATLMGLATKAFPIVAFAKKLEDNSRRLMEISEYEYLPDAGSSGGSKQRMRTLFRFNITDNRMVDGKPKIIGHYEKVEPPSESLLKRLRENGMSYTAQQRLFSA